MVYAKHHALFNEGEPVDRIIFIKSGWVRRVRGLGYEAALGDLVVSGLTEDVGVDFLGAGNCLGLEGLPQDIDWGYTATVLQRTEVLEISIPRLRADPALREALERSFSEFSPADDDPHPASVQNKPAVAATEREIATGVVDGTNLLVMDMDKCVRCGNCSMACHQVHGHSRLLRRGINIERPANFGGNSAEPRPRPLGLHALPGPGVFDGLPDGRHRSLRERADRHQPEDLHRLRRLRDAVPLQRHHDDPAPARDAEAARPSRSARKAGSASRRSRRRSP